MNIPEGWPTREMIEAAWNQLYTVHPDNRPEPWTNLIIALERALAAAPTPQEAELVARIDGAVDGARFRALKDVKPGDLLYTHPANDELRQALRELHHEEVDAILDALEGKS